jgi:hypothetical protein
LQNRLASAEARASRQGDADRPMSGFEMAAITQGLSMGVKSGDVLFEAAVIGEHRVLVGQLQRALIAGNGYVASGIANQMRIGTGRRGLSKVLRYAGNGMILVNIGLAGADVYDGRAGKSKVVIYGAAAAVSILWPGPGFLLGSAILSGELSGGIDPITRDLDRAVGIDWEWVVSLFHRRGWYLTKFLRYVFFRLYKQQTKVLRVRSEAAISALMFMSVTPMSVVVFLDVLGDEFLWHTSLYDLLGRWTFGALVFACVFLAHFYLLLKTVGLNAIDREFEPLNRHVISGGLAVAAYLILPTLIIVFLAAEFAG